MIFEFLLVPIVFFAIKTIPKIYENVRTNLPLYKEIYRQASWETLVEFCIFRIRVVMTKYLETGLLSGSHTTYNLVYFDGSTRYTLCFPKKRGPCPFSQVITKDGEDVTKKIRMFAGPSHNFHGVPTTPKLLGFTTPLTFIFRSGISVNYENEDVFLFA